MTTTIDISEQERPLAELVSLALAGTEVVLTEGDRPLARLVPIARPGARIPGLHPGAMEAAEDFDEPLPDAFWTGGEWGCCSTRTSSSGGIVSPLG